MPKFKTQKMFTKLICLLLVIATLGSTMIGCSSDDEDEWVIYPEEQLFEDKYERKDYITNSMGYATDYITSWNTSSTFSNMDIVNLFDHIKVQVDDWDCITIGISTMGQIAKVVDDANERYVTARFEAIVAERQAAIDAEYEAAKQKAEAKGKTYDKPKKEVVTDDIRIDNPYSYTVTQFTNGEVPEQYQPTYLIDPSVVNIVLFDVAKYGIPYVRFEFRSVSSIYNNQITQESDWVVNAVRAADVSAYIPEEGQTPSFVDSDGRNKAAKNNIYMSGNIALGGSFTWESLMKLCNALNLEWGGKYNSFNRSSDSQFRYYTITLISNPFEDGAEDAQFRYDPDELYVPCIRLVATFDPLTQACINWTIDMFTTNIVYRDKNHDVSDKIHVNVHEYQVDTNDYPGMRETIKSWIAANAVPAETVYYAFDQNKKSEKFGVVETGISNAQLEIVVDGTLYYAIDAYAADGAVSGSYVSAEVMEQAELEENPDAYISKNTKYLTIECCLVNDEDEIIGRVVDGENTLMKPYDSQKYYIADYEWTDTGYHDVKVLTQESLGRLITVYTKTYKLDSEQNAELQSIANNDGPLAVRDYVNNMFAEAEEAQKDNKDKDFTQESKLSNITIGEERGMLTNFTGAKLATFGYEDGGYSEFAVPLAALGEVNFCTKSYHKSEDDYVEICEQDNVVYAIHAESDDVKFYNDIHIGMSIEDARVAVEDLQNVQDSGFDITATDGLYTIRIGYDFEEDEEVVGSVLLVRHDYMDKFDQDAYNEEVSDAIDDAFEEIPSDPQVQAVMEFDFGHSTEVNTEADLSKFNYGETEFDINALTHEAIAQGGLEASLTSSSTAEMNGVKIEAEMITYVSGDATVFYASNQPEKTEIGSIASDTDVITFYGGLKVGMTLEEAKSVMGEDVENIQDAILVLRSADNILYAMVDLETETVNQIALIRPEFYFG